MLVNKERRSFTSCTGVGGSAVRAAPRCRELIETVSPPIVSFPFLRHSWNIFRFFILPPQTCLQCDGRVAASLPVFLPHAAASVIPPGDEELSGDSPQIPPLSTALISGLRRRVGRIVLRAGETLAHLFTDLPLLFAATLSSVGTASMGGGGGRKVEDSSDYPHAHFLVGFSERRKRETMRQLGGVEGVLEKHVPTGIFSSSKP